MKRLDLRHFLALVLLSACVPVSPSAGTQATFEPPAETATPIPALPGWELVWHDEFNGAATSPPKPVFR